MRDPLEVDDELNSQRKTKKTYLQDVSTLVLLEYLHSNCCHTSSSTRSCYRYRKGKKIDILNSHKHAITFKQTFDYTW